MNRKPAHRKAQHATLYVVVHPKTWPASVWRYVSSAPLTYLWLTILLITTIIQRVLTGRQLHTVLVDNSTNIHHLSTDPLEVLVSSLLWIDGKYWAPYAVLFTLFLAPAERWLGHMRWLTVGLTAHIVATYISETVLYLLIRLHHASEHLVHASDIGVSYFLVGVTAVLTYHIVQPWRWAYLAALIAIFGFALIVNPDFTAIGHVAAVLIGLCFYPTARKRRGPPLNPARIVRRKSGEPAA